MNNVDLSFFWQGPYAYYENNEEWNVLSVGLSEENDKENYYVARIDRELPENKPQLIEMKSKNNFSLLTKCLTSAVQNFTFSVLLFKTCQIKKGEAQSDFFERIPLTLRSVSKNHSLQPQANNSYQIICTLDHNTLAWTMREKTTEICKPIFSKKTIPVSSNSKLPLSNSTISTPMEEEEPLENLKKENSTKLGVLASIDFLNNYKASLTPINRSGKEKHIAIAIKCIQEEVFLALLSEKFSLLVSDENVPINPCRKLGELTFEIVKTLAGDSEKAAQVLIDICRHVHVKAPNGWVRATYIRQAWAGIGDDYYCCP